MLVEIPSPLPPAWCAAAVERMSPTERDRLARIQRPLRRNQFIVGHTVLRAAAQRGFGVSGVEVVDQRAVLAGAGAPRASLAHSGQRVAVLLAAPAAGSVGVDLEAPRTLRDPAALLSWLGCPVPPAAELNAEALRRWTVAEARFKCGERGAPPRAWWTSVEQHTIAVAGLDQPPDSFDFDLVAGTYNPRRVEWHAVDT